MQKTIKTLCKAINDKVKAKAKQKTSNLKVWQAQSTERVENDTPTPKERDVHDFHLTFKNVSDHMTL